MKIIVVIVFQVLFIFHAYGENEVPAQKATIEINGREYTIIIGETSQITIGEDTHSIRVKINTLNTFNQAGLKFDYPSNMLFESEALGFGVTQWNLDGTNITVIVQEYKVPATKNMLLGAFKDQYELMKAEISASEIIYKTKDNTLEGVKFNIVMGNIGLVQEFYFLMNKDGKSSKVLILQDMPDDQGDYTEEFISIKKTISETLEVIE